MIKGKVLRPDKAKKLGLVDHLIQPIGPGLTDPLTGTHRYLEEVAVQTCAQLADGKIKVTRNKPFMSQVGR
jgi:enoyl-CoA hydratase / long-chain 3-hydroxyacyl-CoA dehydrogenase